MINKNELISLVNSKTELSKKDAETAVNAVFDIMLEELSKGNEVKIAGFGMFEVKKRASKRVVSPGTKEFITIPAQKAVTFRQSKQAKDVVNK